ncbi:Uncharacterized protein FKW44_004649 [Caligus rogercresseyi]|uniref:DUF7041 domain-containing protein n=1 Tax=Caligus rogercresseyi TaxID=217165 RepID=A0A7T8KA18_CALRO|nr:Uncharacterized protein FKW44_004649 [Caligus rogercresseyi]
MDSKDMSHMAELVAHTTAAMLQQLGLACQGGLATAVAEPATAAINAVNKVSVQVPPFWSKDPDLWFAKVEAQFATANVTASSTKFNHILKSLDQDTVREIREVVRNPRRGHEYEDIKAELLEIFGQSQASKDAEVFGLSGLGDRKPTSVLRHIRGLATDKEMLIRLSFWCNYQRTSERS